MSNIIKASDFKGTYIEKALNTDLSKAETLELIQKAGEGSKGGHVIGHTKSGKPIYQAAKADDKRYKNFTAEDHKDAQASHGQASYHHEDQAYHSQNYPAVVHGHDTMRKHHDTISESHKKRVHDIQRRDLTPDEKKIVAVENKKQADHHHAMSQFHNDMIHHVKKFQKERGLQNDESLNNIHRHHFAEATKHDTEKERLEKE